MRIRQMTAEDIPAVAQIEKECFSQPWSEQGFLDGMKDAIFFVAEDPQIAGYIGMYRMPPEGEITNVAVTRKMRKKGCGRELLLRMQQWADEHGIDRIILEVRSGNEPAIHLYRTCGFEKIGVRKNFYQFPREDADIMEAFTQFEKEQMKADMEEFAFDNKIDYMIVSELFTEYVFHGTISDDDIRKRLTAYKLGLLKMTKLTKSVKTFVTETYNKYKAEGE